MTKLLAFFRGIPTLAYALLAVAVLIGMGVGLHVKAVHNAISAAEKRGEDRAYARVEAKALALAAKAQALATDLRNRNNETNRRIAADADALRLRGPGRASCPGYPAPAASGHNAPGRPGDAAVDRLPDQERLDLIALPFSGTVAFAEQCDLNRAEVLTWREYSAKLLKAWPK